MDQFSPDTHKEGFINITAKVWALVRHSRVQVMGV
ncbi:hypothetical protein SMWOGL2_29580 [Sporomusa malonica]